MQNKLSLLAGRGLDLGLWLCFLLYLIGGIQIDGELRLTHMTRVWYLLGSYYIVARLVLNARFRETTFGSTFISTLEKFIHAFRQKSLRPLKKTTSLEKVFVLSAVYVVVLFFLGPWVRHWSFRSLALDMGHFENIIYRGAFLNELSSYYYSRFPEPPRMYLWQDHFNFGLLPIAMIYQYFPWTETLLTLQSFFLLLPMIPLYQISKKFLPKTLPVWLPLIYYMLWNPMHESNDWDWHAPPFMIAFSLWALYYIETKKIKLALIHMFLMAIWREDAWWTFAGMSLYMGIRTKKWNFAAPAALIGFILFPLQVAFFKEAISVGDRYAFLGPDMKSAITNVLTKPWILIQAAMQEGSLVFWLKVFFATGGALFIFGGWSLLAVIPQFFEVGLSSEPNQTAWYNHYPLLFTGPILFSTILGWKRVLPKLQKKFGAKGVEALVGVSAALCLFQIQCLEPGRFRTNYAWYPKTRCYEGLIQNIPGNVPVMTTNPFYARLAARDIVTPDFRGSYGSETWYLYHPEEIPTKFIGTKGPLKEQPLQVLTEDCGGFILAKKAF